MQKDNLHVKSPLAATQVKQLSSRDPIWQPLAFFTWLLMFKWARGAKCLTTTLQKFAVSLVNFWAKGLFLLFLRGFGPSFVSENLFIGTRVLWSSSDSTNLDIPLGHSSGVKFPVRKNLHAPSWPDPLKNHHNYLVSKKSSVRSILQACTKNIALFEYKCIN